MKISRAELNKKYNIDNHSWTRKHDLVMEHLSDYMTITETKEKGQYVYEIVGTVPETIPPIPRKSKRAEIQQDYDEFVSGYFHNFLPRYASRAKVAREGMAAFGTRKYGHNNAQSVAQKYISFSFEKYVEEVPGSRRWVWYETYEPLDKDTLQRWLDILKEEHITEEQQAEAFRDYADGEDISKAVGYYKRAISKFYEEFHDYTVKVAQYLRKI